MPDRDPEELLRLAERLAADASQLVLAGLAGGLRHIDTKSSLTDVVTEMDRAAEQLIVSGLSAARPGDAVLGEEGAESQGTTGIEWFVDPIDGTTNYLYGLPGFAVSIGAADERGHLVGVVSDAWRGEVYTAIRGRGARRGGAPVHASAQTELSMALVATGFSYEVERRRRQAEVLTVVLPQVRDIRRMGAASVDLCNVASGRVDGYWERGLHDWDKAAGILVAREAGALVCDRASGLTVAGAPGVFEALCELLLGAGADHA